MQATVCNIQRYSIQDGPGIRTTIFFKGCPLQCMWCSNPEGQREFIEVGYRASLCNACGRCLLACELNAMSLTKRGIRINRKVCDNCTKCVGSCDSGALVIYGIKMTADEIMEEVLRDIIYYNKSGGGVTASGGEPCMQAEFLSDLFRRCKRKGIHTTLETSGFVPSTALEEILAYTELVLYDVKLMDSAVHERLTGYGNELILENIKIIERMNIPFFLRIPLIPEINDNEKNLKATAQFAKRWRGVQGIDLLPYHRFGMMKYKMLGRSYELEKIQTPSLEQIERAKNIIESFNFACQVGG